jgi:hypothetical protein
MNYLHAAGKYCGTKRCNFSPAAPNAVMNFDSKNTHPEDPDSTAKPQLVNGLRHKAMCSRADQGSTGKTSERHGEKREKMAGHFGFSATIVFAGTYRNYQGPTLGQNVSKTKLSEISTRLDAIFLFTSNCFKLY